MFISRVLPAATADNKEILSLLYSQKSSYQTKKHLELAISFCKKGQIGSFREEIEILKLIDKESAGLYERILNPDTPTDNTAPPRGNVTPSTSETGVLAQKYTRAQSYYRESKLGEAINRLNEMLSINKNNSEAKQMLATIESEKFLTDDSRPFQALVKQLFDEALVSYRRGNHREAEEKFIKAGETDPTNMQVKQFFNINAEKLNRLKDIQEWENTLDKADKLRFDGSYGSARKLYEKVLSSDPENHKAAFHLKEFDSKCEEYIATAKAQLYSGEISGSSRSVKTALEYNASSEKAEVLKNEIDAVFAKMKNSEKEKKKIIKLYNKGVDEFGRGEYEEAIKTWQAVLDIFPTDPGAARNIETAKVKIMERDDKKSGKINAALLEADEYAKQGLLEKARSKYEYVLRIAPKNSGAIEGIKKIEAMKEVSDGQINRR